MCDVGNETVVECLLLTIELLPGTFTTFSFASSAAKSILISCFRTKCYWSMSNN